MNTTRMNELVVQHWNYIENLLLAHDIPSLQLEIARFHYKEAFKHGYKHAYEDQMMEKDNEQL
jgi:hypothetical protein